MIYLTTVSEPNVLMILLRYTEGNADLTCFLDVKAAPDSYNDSNINILILKLIFKNYF